MKLVRFSLSAYIAVMVSPSKKKLKKELGLFNVYALATGATLSAGFFLLPGIAVKGAGPAVALSYLIAVIPLVPAMFSIIELATAMPKSGGTYYFLDRSMGPVIGTIGGLGTWLALMLKVAFALIGIGAYLKLYLPKMEILPLAILMALFFGGVNLVGAKKAGTLQMILVCFLLCIFAWFLSGVTSIQTVYLHDFFQNGWENILSTAGLVYISYVGITKVASVSEEVKNPERNLPLGIILSLATSVVIYISGTMIMVGVLGVDALSTDLTPAASAAGKIWGKWGQALITFASIIAFSSVVNAGILAASRYPLAMSRDHLFPGMFQKLGKNGQPIPGILLTVGLILLALFLNPMQIAKLASAFQLLMFAFICLAVVIMRESRIEAYDPGFKSPWYPWMQIAGFILPFILIAQMGMLAFLFSAGLMFCGALWYFKYAAGKVSRHGAIYHVFERLGQQRYGHLETELRGIMKEKGLRAEDPFDEIIARAQVFDASFGDDFESVARKAAVFFGRRTGTNSETLFEGFIRGTRLGATPVAGGIALPHLRLPSIEHPEIFLARAKNSITITAMDPLQEDCEHEDKINAVFFLVSPEENPGQHLRILAQIAGRVEEDLFMNKWLTANGEQEIKETLLRDECHISIQILQEGPTRNFASKFLYELDFPEGCLVALVQRKQHTFVPSGKTRLLQGDRLTIIGEKEGIKKLCEMYNT